MMRFNFFCASLLMLTSCAVQASHISARKPTDVHYVIVERISAPGTDWDYLSVDPIARRLYIAHNGVMSVDLDTGKVTPRLVPGQLTHGVLPLADGMAVVDDSGTGVLHFFDGATGKVHATLQIPKPPATQGFRDPDALALEPRSGLLVVVNADSGELVLVNPRIPAIVDTVRIGGNLEFAAADGKGTVFVNSSSTNEILAVDISHRKITARYPLNGCEEPSGLAFDPSAAVLVSVCDNGVAKFIDAASGRDLKTIPIGKGPDAAILDDQRHLVFVPSGEDGTLAVIAVRSATDIVLIETVPTQIGTRSGAVDLKTGRLYLPTARFNPPTSTFPFPSAKEGTFEILVVAER